VLLILVVSGWFTSRNVMTGKNVTSWLLTI